ncbi:hypothetical protein ScalyP_jg743, partial [Parmales sp. scaly parma]
MNKPVGDLTIDDDSDVCTLANELRLIGAPKKKEKGKGNEAMLGVKEKKKKKKKKREQLLGRGEEEEVSLYANRFIKIGNGAQVSVNQIPPESEEDWVANAKEAEAGEKLEGIMERKKFLVWKGGRSEEDDEKVAEFLKEFDVRDEGEVLEKLLEAK